MWVMWVWSPLMATLEIKKSKICTFKKIITKKLQLIWSLLNSIMLFFFNIKPIFYLEEIEIEKDADFRLGSPRKVVSRSSRVRIGSAREDQSESFLLFWNKPQFFAVFTSVSSPFCPGKRREKAPFPCGRRKRKVELWCIISFSLSWEKKKHTHTRCMFLF